LFRINKTLIMCVILKRSAGNERERGGEKRKREGKKRERRFPWAVSAYITEKGENW